MKPFAKFPATLAVFTAMTIGSSAFASDTLEVPAPSKPLSKIERQKLLEAARQSIDTTTTGSVTSGNAFDARGVIRPNAEATLGAGVSAKIADLPFKDGEAFRKGEALVRFDCAKQNADLRGARASLSKAASIYESKKRLKARGAAGSQEVRDAAADVATAKAKADALQEVITLCLIEAPFDGRVVERHAETHEIPAANAPILTVVDDSALELDLIVPSTWLRWIQKGSGFQFAVDELGQTYDAKVVRLGAKVDAVSQTIKLTGRFTQRPGSVLAGMSGTATFAPPSN